MRKLTKIIVPALLAAGALGSAGVASAQPLQAYTASRTRRGSRPVASTGGRSQADMPRLAKSSPCRQADSARSMADAESKSAM